MERLRPNINVKATIGATNQVLREGTEKLRQEFGADMKEFASDFTSEFNLTSLSAVKNESGCQAFWRLWLVLFVGVNLLGLLAATIYIFTYRHVEGVPSSESSSGA